MIVIKYALVIKDGVKTKEDTKDPKQDENHEVQIERKKNMK